MERSGLTREGDSEQNGERRLARAA